MTSHARANPISQIQAKLTRRAPKTVNNVLTVLNTMLRKSGDSGAGRPCGSLDDTEVHASESGGDRGRDSVVEHAARHSESRRVWGHSGHAIHENVKYLRGKKLLERATGIEPVSEAWEASVLPLY